MHKTAPKKASATEVAWRARDSRARLKRRNEPGNWIERERVAPILLDYIERHDRRFDSKALSDKTLGGSRHASSSAGSTSGREYVAAESGMNVRSLWRYLGARPCVYVRNGRVAFEGAERFLSIDTVDRLFVAMNCVDLFHVEPSYPGASDGFADVYFHPTVLEAEVEDDLEVALTGELLKVAA